MTREELIEALRAVPVHDPLREEVIVHLTRDTYRERLDRMVGAFASCGDSPEAAIKYAKSALAAIDAEVERKAGEP